MNDSNIGELFGAPGTAGTKTDVPSDMHNAAYYRQRAAQAKRLARAVSNTEVVEQLLSVASDYDEIAEDLEAGASEVRHPELLPQLRRSV